MHNFYSVSWDDDAPGSAVELTRGTPDVAQQLIQHWPVESWVRPEFKSATPDVDDYPANDVGVRLCSQRFKEAVETYVTGVDRAQWLPAWVDTAEGRGREFFVLHLQPLSHVVDTERSIIVGDLVIKPVLRQEMVTNLHIFTYLGGVTRMVVADPIRNLLLDRRCTGMEFTKCPVV
jgi:hypothetical protein